MSNKQEAAEFANRIKELGFIVYLAESGTYGFITDDTEARVLSFSVNDGGSLSGNYGPPSTQSGTGWRLEQSPWQLKTAEDVKRALYEQPNPRICGNSWKHFTTVKQHLAMYESSSKYQKVQP